VERKGGRENAANDGLKTLGSLPPNGPGEESFVVNCKKPFPCFAKAEVVGRVKKRGVAGSQTKNMAVKF